MSQLIARSVSSPLSLQWWEWGQIHGVANVAALFLCLLAGVDVPPVAVAVLLHFAVDYSMQSDEVALNKGKRGSHLLVYALATTTAPAVAACFTGNAGIVLVAVGVGAMSHWAIDATRKFGISNVVLGAAVDQMCHMLVYVALFL